MAPYPFHCPSDVTADFHPCLWHSHQSGPSTHPRHQPEKKRQNKILNSITEIAKLKIQRQIANVKVTILQKTLVLAKCIN